MKNHMFKRLLALAVAMVMVLGMLPELHLHAHAEGEEEVTAPQSEDWCGNPLCSQEDNVHVTSCAQYVAPENPVCYCVEKCAEPNIWCDVCGFDYTQCGGTDRAVGYDTGWELEGTTLKVTGHLTALPEGVEYNKIEVHEGGNLDLGEATVTCDVDNDFGTISSGTFNTKNIVSNYSIISGGTFHADVNNEYGATISGGTFTKKVRNDGTISGGDFISRVINKGTITGGTIWYGTVTNKESGTISNAKFESNAKLAEGSTPPQSVIHSVNGEDVALTYNAALPAALGDANAWYHGDTQVTDGTVPLNYTTYVGEYAVNTAAATNGTVSVPATAKYGQTVTITTTPANGYLLNTLTVINGGAEVTVTDNTFTMPAGAVTVTATFSADMSGIQPGYYLVGILNGENKWELDSSASTRLLREDPGTAGQYYLNYSLSNGDKVKIAYFDGTTITQLFQADGKEAYAIDTSKAGTVKILFRPEGNDLWSYTYFAVTPAYNVTVNTVENGTVSTDKAVATNGETVTLTVTPAEGYELVKLEVVASSGSVDLDEENYTFTMPNQNVTVTAYFQSLEKRTVYFDNSAAQWSQVNIYFWSDSNSQMSSWPGVGMIKAEGNIYSCQIPTDAEYVIFNNGSSKTNDQILGDKNCCKGNVSGSTWYTYPCEHTYENGTCTACGKACEHTSTGENVATCVKKAVCDLCGTSYGEVDKTNHDSSVECVNGFCPYCDAFEPAVLVDGVYQISNAGNLYWFADKVTNENAAYGSADAILTADITVNENVLAADGTANAGTFREWMPIGKLGFINYNRVYNPYTGTFEGNGKTVSGLYFNDTSANFSVGLFSVVGEGGTVRNVGVADSYICGNDPVGAVAGNNYGSVTGCYHTGTVISSGTASGVVGGNSGTVTNCYNTGTVSGESIVGGVVGNNIVSSGEVYYNPIVTDCYNSGTVSGTSSVGGVVGHSSGDSRHKGIVTGCYNTGTVSGTTDVGGVVGFGSASNCYNTGTVSGTSDVGGVVGNCMGEASLMGCYNTGTVSGTTNVGGVAGYLMGESILEGCYNTGTVSGEDEVGGVVGWNWNGTCTNCYFDSTVYTGNAIGTNEGTATNVEGKSTEQFASGEVAYLLSQGEKGDIWGQDLDNGKPAQTAPTFTGAKVYYGYRSCGDTEKVYTNNANVFPEKPEHTQNPTYTDNHDGTHSAVYPCCGTTVSPKPHAMDTATGKCVCGLEMAEASVTIGGATTHYEILHEAIQAVSTATAADNARVKLLKSIDLGDAEQYVSSGEFTLDLNGQTLSSNNTNSALRILNATVTITDNLGGGEIKGKTYGVDTRYSTLTIMNATITATGEGCIGLYANNCTAVTIKGATISGASQGVNVTDCTVLTITDAAITATGKYGYGMNATSCNVLTITDTAITAAGESGNSVNASACAEVTIEGGTFSGGFLGVRVDGGNLTITDAEITSDSESGYGVEVYECAEMTIEGGTIRANGASGVGVNLYKCTNATMKGTDITANGTEGRGVQSETCTLTIQDSAVTATEAVCSRGSEIRISGGSITGSVYDLVGTVKLMLPASGTGTTFPGGITVTNADLDSILGEGAAYWQGSKMIVPEDGQRKITGGDVTIQKACDHQGNTNVPFADNGDGTHSAVYPCCGTTVTEDHAMDTATGKCVCGLEMAEASVTMGFAGGIAGDGITTYYETLSEAISSVSTATADDNATVTLLKDNDAGQNVYGGVFTLDLNGKDLKSRIDGLYISGSGTNVTIADSKVGGEVSGESDGVRATENSTVTISGGSVSGNEFGVNADNCTVTISGGSVGGEFSGVNAENSTVTISGGTVSGNGQGVYVTENSTVTISSGTVSGSTFYGASVNDNSTVTISGGTVSGGNGGVIVSENSTVEIRGGEVGGYYAVNAISNSTVKISGGIISNNVHGVSAAENSTVTISGGNISSDIYGVEADNSTVTISGGNISSDVYGVYAENSTVTISGGSITGSDCDLFGTVKLMLPASGTGTTFPGGITVTEADLDSFLGEGAAYWQGSKMIVPEDGQQEITGGDVTIQKACDHSGNTNKTYADNGDGTHSLTCSVCYAAFAEEHTQPLAYVNLEDEGHKAFYPCCQKAEDVAVSGHEYENGYCACLDAQQYTATFMGYSEGLEITNPTPEHGKDYVTQLTGSAPHFTFMWINCGTTQNVPYTFDQQTRTLTIAGTYVDGNVVIAARPYVKVTIEPNGGERDGSSEAFTITPAYKQIPEEIEISRTGYRLAGWNTKADGTGDGYDVDAFVATQDITLYAQWECIHTLGEVEFRDNGDGTHNGYCGECGALLGNYVERPHVYDATTHLCPCGVIETFTVTVYDGNDNIEVSLTNATATYGQDFTAELTSDAEKQPHYEIRYYDVGEDRYDDFTYENGKLTIPAANITGDIEIRVYPYVTVTFHGNGGIFTEPASGTQYDPLVREKDYGETGYLLQESTEYREGYAFAGLNTKPDGTGASYRAVGEYTYTEDLVLYAQWEVNTYTYQVETYTMDAYGNYGEPVTEEKSAAYGTTVNATPNSGAEGFYLDAEHENSLLTATVPANNDLVLKVYIGRNQYPITWDLNGGGTEYDDLPDSMYYGVSQLTVWDQFTREGYTFSHLEDTYGNQYVDGSPNSDCRRFYDVDMPAGGLTLKAIWDVNTYALHAQDQVLDVDYGTNPEDALAGITPEKTGYTHTGWKFYVDEGCTKEYTGTTMPASDLYAQSVFTPIEYNITWILNGCTVNTEIGKELPETLPYTGNTDTHQLLVALDEPAGYKLVGFRDGNGNELSYSLGNGYLFLPVTGDMTVKAVIQPKAYMATWETGDGGSYEKEFKFGEVITIPNSEIFQETFRKAGHTLTGWEGYTEGMTMPIDGVTFTAVYAVNPYTITFDSDGGTAVAPITQDYGTAITAPSAPTKDGFHFSTWDPAIPETMPGEDTTLTAIWEAHKDYTYTASGDTITAFCGVCHQVVGTAKLHVTGKTYDATPVTATVTCTMEGVDAPQITYSGNINAGTYTASIILGDATAKADFTITPAVVTVRAEATSKIYGQGDPALNCTIQGLIGTDALSGSPSRAAGENAGSYAITVGTLANDNYIIDFIPANLTILPKTITVKADAVSKVYGQADPEFTYQAEGLVNGDKLTGELKREAGEDAGTYAITLGTLANSNYAIQFTGDKLTVTKAQQTITLDTGDVSLACGKSLEKAAQAEGAVTYSSSDASIVKVDASGKLTALKPGTVTITVKAAETGNYLPAQATYTVTVSHGHIAAVTAPTCEAKGYTTYTCPCGDSYVADYTDALGHDYKGKVTLEATCTAEGVMTYTCENDASHSYTEVIPVKAHTPKAAVEENRVEATCTEKGSYELATYCDACGKELGRTQHTIDAIGHDYDDGVITTQPDCENEGVKTFTCANDKSHTYTETVAPTGHSPKAAVEENRVEATCTEKGSYELATYCGTCGKELGRTQHEIPAKGHSFGSWTVVKAATCTEKGLERRDCSNCDQYETRATAFTGHSYRDAMDPSCEVCGEHRAVYVESIPMLRLYNPVTGEHHYTGSAEERDTLVSLGWNYEGVAWNAPVEFGDPVCRYFNPNTGDHHYTMCGIEGNNLVDEGWIYEGVAWNSASSEHLPIYRLYNPNAEIGAHHYTGSAEERDNLVAEGWSYEGIGWYALLY